MLVLLSLQSQDGIKNISWQVASTSMNWQVLENLGNGFFLQEW